jgi:hypothetical protein
MVQSCSQAQKGSSKTVPKPKAKQKVPEVTVSVTELEAMKEEISKLRRANKAEANKAAEEKRKLGELILHHLYRSSPIVLDTRKRTALQLSQEKKGLGEDNLAPESSDTDGPSSKRRKVTGPILAFEDTDLDEEEEDLANRLPQVNKAANSRRVVMSEEPEPGQL